MKKYFKHKLENLINVSKIVTIHYFEFDKNFKSTGEAHDFWEIVYAEKESVIYPVLKTGVFPGKKQRKIQFYEIGGIQNGDENCTGIH